MKKQDPVREYLASIGKQGGKERAARHSKAKLREWGKLGGRPKKINTNKSNRGK